MYDIEIIKKKHLDYYLIVKDILDSSEFQKRKEYDHHENESVYDHSIKVSFLSYRITKKMKRDYRSAAIGGLLHDFYYRPWQENGKLTSKEKQKNIFKKHGFIHAGEAMNNAYIFFPELMNKKIENIIRRHMFPLNIVPPRYLESWVIVFADKYVSLSIFKNIKGLPKYIGIQKKGIK